MIDVHQKFLQQRLGASFSSQIGVALPPFGDNMAVSFLGGSFLGLTRVAEKRGQSRAAADLVSYLATGRAAAQYGCSFPVSPRSFSLSLRSLVPASGAGHKSYC
jgi:hypothetical protein